MERKPIALIEKFLRNDCSYEELSKLKKWIEQPENREYLKDEIKLYHLINAHFQAFDAEKAYINKTVLHTNQVKTKQPTFRPWLKYAAILIAIIGLGYIINTSLTNTRGTLIIPDENITLSLEDGSLKTINATQAIKQIVAPDGSLVSTQKGDTLFYGSSKPARELTYNTLNVPYGKTFKLRLSDGTYAHLNAGTQLRYPVKFGIGDRQVFLRGEAYFEVARNEAAPFIVNTKELDVRVLGTRFNVSAYNDDKEVSTVLVEGSVGLYEEGVLFDLQETTLLLPGQLGQWDRQSGEITVRQVDVQDHISWMEGKVIFYKKPFEDILKVLERKYNVRIENRYPVLNKQRYKAIFDNETIEQVMETFTNSRLFSYTIEDNIIIIDKPSADR